MYQKEKERYRFSFKTRENLYLIQFQVQSQTLLIAVFLVPRANFLDQARYVYLGGLGEELLVTALRNPKDYMRTPVARTAFVLKSQRGNTSCEKEVCFRTLPNQEGGLCLKILAALTAIFWPLSISLL